MYSTAQATEELIARRKAAWALSQLCNHIGLGTLAERFDPEYPDEWLVYNAAQVHALKNRKIVAEIMLDGDMVKVIIPDIFRIVRQKHLSDFIPEEFGIQHRTTENFIGDEDPDLVADFALPDDQILFHGPPQPFPRQATARAPKVIGSL